jgi:hypothetical protein
MPMTNYAQEKTFRHMASFQIEQKMHVRHVDEAALGDRYAEHSEKISKILLFLIIPLCALPLWALYFWKRRLLFDHLVLATEINSVFVIFMFLVIPLLFRGVGAILLRLHWVQPRTTQGYGDQQVILWIYYAFLFGYCTVAFRRFYQPRWFWSVGTAAVFTFLHGYIIFQLYRFLLFETTMSTL